MLTFYKLFLNDVKSSQIGKLVRLKVIYFIWI